MDEFKKEFDMTSGDGAENSVTENNNDNSKSEQTAAFEMNEVSTTQENIPSQAEAKIEISDKTENTASSTETASYSYSGSALGGNARESFNQNSQYSGTNYRNQNSQSQSANTSYNTQGSTSYQSGPYSNQAYNNGFNAAYKSNGNGNPGVPYNEHINKKKTDKKSVRYVAALVAAAVLNLAVLGGAFALGHSFGSKSGTVTNKTTLSEQLKTDDGQSSGGSTGGARSTASTTGSKDTTEIAKEVGPAVVGIKSTVQGQMSLFGGYSTSEAQGSGIIISADGYIVTNNHVVADSSSVSVQLNTGSEYAAKVIGADDQTDLAVIKIEPTEELTVANLGDSTKVEVGETAIAIGNPMGLEFFGSVTQGIVSAVNRTVQVDNRTMNLIQTDAAINSGNSGGALVNSKGEVIGINAVKVTTTGVEGMGFAIPISEAKPIISDLLDYGYVKGRPVIGLSTRDVSAYMAQQYGWPQGAQIMSVTTDNARNAGLQQGDIITKIDDKTISKGSDLTEYKDTKSPGDTVKLEVYKYATGKTESVSVVLSEQIPD